MQNNRIDMPEELKPCYNPHQVNIDYPYERHLAFTFFILGVQFFKEFVETEGLKKTKELIKKTSLIKAIDFRDVFSGGEVCGNTCLVPIGRKL